MKRPHGIEALANLVAGIDTTLATRLADAVFGLQAADRAYQLACRRVKDSEGQTRKDWSRTAQLKLRALSEAQDTVDDLIREVAALERQKEAA